MLNVKKIKFPEKFLFLGAIVFFLFLSFKSLGLFFFGDEGEKFIAAKMLMNGDRLYEDIFAHHAPLTFMVNHFYAYFIDQNNFYYVRVFVTFLFLISAFSIVKLIENKNKRKSYLEAAIFVMFISILWRPYSLNMILYQNIGGFLLVIPLVSLVMPFLMKEGEVSKKGALVSGAAMTFACFSAYSFGPTVIIFSTIYLFCDFRKNRSSAFDRFLFFVAGIFLALLINILWIIKYSSLLSFYEMHFRFNNEIYSDFISFKISAIKNSFKLGFNDLTFGRDSIVVLFWFAIFLFLFLRKNGFLNLVILILCVLAICFSNPRGGMEAFHAASFIILSSAFISSVFSGLLVEHSSAIKIDELKKTFILLVLMILFGYIVNGHSKSIFGEFRGGVNSKSLVPNEDGEAGLIKRITKEKDKIISYIYRSDIYYHSERLPAVADHYYLPWAAQYHQSNKNYRFKRNVCSELINANSNLIFFDNWKVWDRYSLSEYDKCTYDFINSKYKKLEGTSVFVKNELLWDFDNYLSAKPILSKELSPSNLIKLNTLFNKIDSPIESISILFGTFARSNSGVAKLTLEIESGGTEEILIPLNNLKDNKYYSININSNNYIGASIKIDNGGGVVVWEREYEGGNRLSCIQYRMLDGSFALTPGCPVI